MKKVKCLICGENIIINEENITTCPQCKNEIDLDLLTKKDKIKTLKHEALTYIINNEYNKVITFIDNNYNSLLLEYYKMFSYISLKKEYNKDLFYNANLNYTSEELYNIIIHMIEHQDMFINEEIMQMIEKSEDKKILLDILNNKLTGEAERIKEQELRILLFNKTVIPQVKPYDRRKREGLAFMIISVIIYIVSFLLVLFFTDQTIKYYLFNVITIFISILLAIGIMKYKFKKNNIYLTILMVIGLLYVLTLPGLLFSDSYNLLNHHVGLIKSPVELFVTLLEGMEFYEK